MSPGPARDFTGKDPVEPRPEASPEAEQLELAERLARSKKYRHLPSSTLRDVVRHEWGRHKRKAQTLAHCRRRLHKILAGYLSKIDFGAAEADLSSAFESGRDEKIEAALRRILSCHASTLERIQNMEAFFQKILRVTGRPRAIADLACAVTPLSFRWMGLPRTTKYFAFDISAPFLELVSHYFGLEEVPFETRLCDIVVDPIAVEADLCFLFKMYHCLEIRRSGAGWHAVESAPGRFIAVSFPTRNLRGRQVDIAGNYLQTIRQRVAARRWRLTELETETERVLLVEKS